MTTKEIPSKIVHTCDFCLKEVQTLTKADRAKHWAKFSIYRTAYDMMDNPAADGTVHYDACDECNPKLVSLINDFAEHMKNAA